MLIDEVTLTFKAGKGGDGSPSFAHNPGQFKGGPDGGDGGKGGNIYLVGDPNLNSLTSLSHVKEIDALDGVDGAKNKMHGKNADDKFVKIALGTEVIEINPENGKEYFLFEVTEAKEYLLAKGGRGGWGNVHFKSPTNQAPDFAVKGNPGDIKTVKLNLKLIADVGLVGLPNAGKSTLLSVISSAKPKIGAYAFTTLTPNLGFIHGKKKNFIVADLPGLIEGASNGRGLGVKFLKHIEKTRILVHLMDVSSTAIDQDYQTIRHEIESYSPILKDKPEVTVFTKSDLLEDGRLPKTKIKPTLTISAFNGTNTQELLGKLENMLLEMDSKAEFSS